MKVQPKPPRRIGSEEPQGSSSSGGGGGDSGTGRDAARGQAAQAGNPAGGEDGGEQRSRRQEQREWRGQGGGVGRAGKELRAPRRALCGSGVGARNGCGSVLGLCFYSSPTCA
jgi:hypothetical protein